MLSETAIKEFKEIWKEELGEDLPEDLAVKEEYKEQGIGKNLITKIEDYAKQNKIKRILFKTHKKSSAVDFYKKLGYKQNKNILDFEKKIR